MRTLQRNIPFLATVVVCALLYIVAGARYDGFASVRVLVNFFGDNSFLGIAAIGLTFVILSGGIDLSIGGMVGLVSVFLALAIEKWHWHALLAIPLALFIGVIFGGAMGALIQYFALPPFLVTLGGMFFARGLALLLSLESLPIARFLDSINSSLSISLGQFDLPATAILFLLVFAGAFVFAHCTRFGRAIYALGGNEQSAALMGLPIARTKIGVYALSGFCSALAGVVYCLYTQSGNPNAGSGLELDAIAAVVIGGTLLSGGVGYVTGTIVGVLIFGIIQTAIVFQGTLSSWWTKIVIGVLLLLFILLQKLFQAKKFQSSK
ncbi:MAG TPA: galactofuranose ABC transporter, permease protein YjfF [Candidatus Limnocylindria bacterium]|nr:galactofuranose ABC transporter, permease protein YjfF [Candidatus Limnocylindria bacterium]